MTASDAAPSAGASSDAPEVSILVVSYRTRAETLAALRSVFEHVRGTSFELICVDNASDDGSADAIARELPAVHLIASDENLGFAAANNLAAERARGRYLLLLNPDTLLLDDAVSAVLELARAHPAAGLWGGRTLFADGSPNHSSCWRRATVWSEFCAAFGLGSLARASRLFDSERVRLAADGPPVAVDIVSGCFLLIERTLWDRLGGFDRQFFMYAEDADLCLRAGALGHHPLVTPAACLVHLGGASERSRAEKLVKLLFARRLLALKHGGALSGRLMATIGGWRPILRAMAWRLLALVRVSGAALRARDWERVREELRRRIEEAR